jgi:disulfide bond formation protein DsbB
MSEQYQTQKPQSLNPNVAALILVISFGIICGLIVAYQQHNVLPGNTEDPIEVALVVPSETRQPSNTPLPPTPTMTAVPSTAVPTAIVALEAVVEAVPPVEPESNASHDPALVAQGQQSFMLCSACHGPDARGLPNLGKDLVASEFVAGLTDEALLEFIKTGRPLWDPLNTTGIDMPPKGGNPALKDEEIFAIIAYLRSLSAGSGQ